MIIAHVSYSVRNCAIISIKTVAINYDGHVRREPFYGKFGGVRLKLGQNRACHFVCSFKI